MNDKWKQDVEINPDALDCEWVKQASLFGEYCMEQAGARAKLDAVKERLDVKVAGLGLKVRSNPATYGLDKVTEASVQAVILLDVECAKLREEIAVAQYELEVMSAAVRALDQKKSALENLVRLQGQNYFAGPSVPRDVGAEWVKDVERRSARDKVKAATGVEPSRKISRK
ncbi:MAG: hypothetical protein WC455_16965 [Dehalococcoidia bacterium]|jgi:hypothetical protein